MTEYMDKNIWINTYFASSEFSKLMQIFEQIDEYFVFKMFRETLIQAILAKMRSRETKWRFLIDPFILFSLENDDLLDVLSFADYLVFYTVINHFSCRKK